MPQSKPKPAPKAVTPIQRAHPPRELTPIQLEVSEFAADLIANGGRESDVYTLLRAVLSHKWRRRIPVGRCTTQEEQDRRAREYAQTYGSEMFRELVRDWPKKTPSRESPRPTSIAEMVRSNTRNVVRGLFEDFMGGNESGTEVEDLYLMKGVLESWVSGLPLPEAFASEIDNSDDYVKVPYRHKRRVQEFVELLDGCTEAKSA